MVAVNHDASKFKNSDYAQYGIKSWEAWCKKKGIDFMVVEEHNEEYSFPIWNKLDVYEKGKGYEKIAIVDSDTMVHWDAPNPFDLYTDEWCWVRDYANLRWLYMSHKKI